MKKRRRRREILRPLDWLHVEFEPRAHRRILGRAYCIPQRHEAEKEQPVRRIDPQSEEGKRILLELLSKTWPRNTTRRAMFPPIRIASRVLEIRDDEVVIEIQDTEVPIKSCQVTIPRSEIWSDLSLSSEFVDVDGWWIRDIDNPAIVAVREEYYRKSREAYAKYQESLKKRKENG